MIGLTVVVAVTAVISALIALAGRGRTAANSTAASHGPNTLEELFAARLARGELDRAGYLHKTAHLPFTARISRTTPVM